MVALVRDIVTDKPKAIHRTALTRDGLKRSELGSNGRLTLGPVGGGAVKVTADSDVTLALAVGEGLETCLAARNIPGLETMPIWSLMSANQVAQFPVLGGIETLWVVVDHDKTGIEASKRVYHRWHRAFREVVAVTPTISGADLNDVAGRLANA